MRNDLLKLTTRQFLENYFWSLKSFTEFSTKALKFVALSFCFCPNCQCAFLWCGNFFFREGVSATFFRVILMSLIEVQNVFLMINFDVWDRLGHVWTICNIAGLWKSIFHLQNCEDFVSKWAHFSVYKDFISNSLIKAL